MNVSFERLRRIAFRIATTERFDEFINRLQELAKDPPEYFVNFGHALRIAPSMQGALYESGPFGIYVYGLTPDRVDKIFHGYEFYAYDYKYVNILRPRGKILNLGTYSESEFKQDLQKLHGEFGEFFEHLDHDPGFDLYDTIEDLAENVMHEDEEGSSSLEKSSLFKFLGYNGIWDPGLGIIWPGGGQDEQGVIFSTKDYEVVDTFLNPNRREKQDSFEKIKNRFESLNTLQERAEFVEELNPPEKLKLFGKIDEKDLDEIKPLLSKESLEVLDRATYLKARMW